MNVSKEDTSICSKQQHVCKHSLPDALPMAAAAAKQQHTGHAPCPMQTEALLPCSVGHLAASEQGPAVLQLGQTLFGALPCFIGVIAAHVRFCKGLWPPISTVPGDAPAGTARCGAVATTVQYLARVLLGFHSGGQWRQPSPALRRGLPSSRRRRLGSSDFWAVGWQGPRRWWGGLGSRGLPCTSRCPQGLAERRAVH